MATKTTVIISNKEFLEGTWAVDAIVENATGTRRGREYVQAPADATDEDLKALVAALYE